jgi:hypothetical protein
MLLLIWKTVKLQETERVDYSKHIFEDLKVLKVLSWSSLTTAYMNYKAILNLPFYWQQRLS